MRCEMLLTALVLTACHAATPTSGVAKTPAKHVGAPALKSETIADPWVRVEPSAETAIAPAKPPPPAWMQPCTPEDFREPETRAACKLREQEHFRRVAALDPAIDLAAPSDFNPAQSFNPDGEETNAKGRGMFLTAEQDAMTHWPSLHRATVPLMVGREEIFSNMWTGLDAAEDFDACKGGHGNASPFAEHVPACGDALVKNFALLYQRLPSKARDPGCRPANLLDPAFRYANDPACAPPASWKKYGGIALEKICAPVGVYLLLRAVTPYADRYGHDFEMNIEYIAQTLGVVQRLTARSTLATAECKLIPVKPVYMPKR
ncbi:MAG: hypothetical protein JWM74_4371 [Myxococcaceae bacterium]|nr:hypothetical protein [Myxococcaceae bacterium]